MSATIFKGRYVAQSKDEELVVFIIGMRINSIFRFWKWIPVFSSMGPMIKELYQNKQLGFLHTEYLLGWRKVVLIQYWRSFDELLHYAHENKHATAWAAYNAKVKNNGSVGVFHETYKISKGASEAIYVNMPQTGLAVATGHIPVTKDMHSARQRMKDPI